MLLDVYSVQEAGFVVRPNVEIGGSVPIGLECLSVHLFSILNVPLKFHDARQRAALAEADVPKHALGSPTQLRPCLQHSVGATPLTYRTGRLQSCTKFELSEMFFRRQWRSDLP